MARFGNADTLTGTRQTDGGYIQDVRTVDATGAVVAPGTSASPAQVIGNIASGATDSGNPVKVAGVFNTTPATLSNGQRGDMQITSRGEQLVAISQGAVAANVIGTVADGLSNTSTGSLRVQNLGMVFNGTTWDRDTKPTGMSRIVSAAASTNATVAKASAGDLYTVRAYNAAAALRYLKIYNKATAPTVGTDIPVATIPLPPSQSVDVDFVGHYFPAGISYALTQNAADSDTTALVAADVLGVILTYR